MPWTRVALIGSFGLALGCTRPNPGFDDDVGDVADAGSETHGETDATSADEGTSTATSTTSTTMDDSTTGDPPGDLPTANACESDLAEGLHLKFADPFLLGGSCPDMVDLHGLLTYNALNQSLVLNRCADDDLLCQGECGLEHHPVAVDVDLSGFAGSCVSIQGYKPIEDLVDICSWSSISMFLSGNFNTPLVVAVTKGGEPPPQAKLVLDGYPMLANGEACTCEAFGIDEPCCVDDGGKVEFYEFVLPDSSHVVPGESHEFQFGAMPYPYEFRAVQAQKIGTCNTFAAAETSWVMRASF